MSLGDIIDGLSNEPLQFDPGTDRNYSNGGYAILAAVIEIISGQPFGDYIQTTFARRGYHSVGHEAPFAVVENMAHRYAPEPSTE